MNSKQAEGLAFDGRALAPPLTGIGRYVASTLEVLPGRWTALVKPNVTTESFVGTSRPIRPFVKDVVWNELALAPAASEYSAFWAAFGLSPWRRVSPARLVVTIYDTLEREDVGMARGLMATRRAGHTAAALRADVVVAISQTTADSYRRWYGRNADLIAAPAPSVPVPSFEAIQSVRERLEALGWPVTRMALSVGSPIQRKNVVRAVRASGQLPDVKVLLVGGRGDEATEGDLRRLERSGTLVRWGPASQEELGALYQCADVLLFTPLAEGFGIPLLDARMHGLRIVTSQLEPMASASGSSSQLCDPLSEDSIARALRRSLDGPKPNPERLAGWDETAAATWDALTR